MFSQLNEWNAIFLIVHLYVKQLFGVPKIELRPLSLCCITLTCIDRKSSVLFIFNAKTVRYRFENSRSWVINECNATGNPPELR